MNYCRHIACDRKAGAERETNSSKLCRTLYQEVKISTILDWKTLASAIHYLLRWDQGDTEIITTISKDFKANELIFSEQLCRSWKSHFQIFLAIFGSKNNIIAQNLFLFTGWKYRLPRLTPGVPEWRLYIYKQFFSIQIHLFLVGWHYVRHVWERIYYCRYVFKNRPKHAVRSAKLAYPLMSNKTLRRAYRHCALLNPFNLQVILSSFKF